MLNISVNIDGVDRTQAVILASLVIDDCINDTANTCNFTIVKRNSSDFTPNIGMNVIILDGATPIYVGYCLRVRNRIEGKVAYFDIECKDATLFLDRKLINERYENKTVNQIIADIASQIPEGITVNNVDCSIVIKTIAFNNTPASSALQILAENTNFSWYIDYAMDIHFFSKNTEKAPFNLTTTGNKFIYSSLELADDSSQLKNVVVVRGGEKESTNTLYKYHKGDGSQMTFNTDHKYSKLPTVKKNGVTQLVGIEFLDTNPSTTVYWNFDQKYIRFATAPANNDAIEVSGTILIPIYVQVEDPISIGQFGRFEFKKIDTTIKSSEEATQFANAQLEAYAKTVNEGNFRTYETGLGSGQLININLPERGISADYIIQRVSFKMLSNTLGEFTVDLATLRTVGIITFLQKLLINKSSEIALNENDVLEKYYLDNQQVFVQEEISLKSKMQDYQNINVSENIVKDPFGAGVKPDLVWCPYIPTGQTDKNRELIWDQGYWQ